VDLRTVSFDVPPQEVNTDLYRKRQTEMQKEREAEKKEKSRRTKQGIKKRKKGK